VNLQPLQSNLKVLQEQQTQPEHSMFWGAGLTLSCVEQHRFARRIRFLTLHGIVQESVFCICVASDGMRWSKFSFQPGACFFGMIVKRSQSASIGYFPGFLDDVNALGPTSVSQVCRFVHVIHADGQREMKALDEIVGDGDALSERLRLGIANAFVHVAFHLPFVLRMRFANINGQEVRLRFVIVIEIDEVAYLAAEGRSGIAAED
jgi:hypothetical protein